MEHSWSILLFKEQHKEQSKWFAMTLERLVSWWADTPQEALSGLMTALEWQAEADTSSGNQPFEFCPRAPERYWKLYQEAMSIQLPKAPAVPNEVRLAA